MIFHSYVKLPEGKYWLKRYLAIWSHQHETETGECRWYFQAKVITVPPLWQPTTRGRRLWGLGPASEDVQFYLPEQTVPEDAHMVLLAGGHPKKSSTIWRHGSDGRTHVRILRSWLVGKNWFICQIRNEENAWLAMQLCNVHSCETWLNLGHPLLLWQSRRWPQLIIILCFAAKERSGHLQGRLWGGFQSFFSSTCSNTCAGPVFWYFPDDEP